MAISLESLTLDDFAPYLHQEFIIYLQNGEPYALELVELRDLGAAPGPTFRKPFAMTLRNPNNAAYLPQGTYQLEHEHMGSLELFIVPLGPSPEGMQYEITFG
ncbi:MAG: hypothetical protein GX491_01660 [Chloroflexi bacterium]|nr:hypothetical protein [Chloroflexota bacterium]